MSVDEVGCCGAYCGTCREFRKTCKGCTIGYLDGARDLKRARCEIKICCITKGYASCADCAHFDSCQTIQDFHSHKGYKYGKYQQAIEYITAHGYDSFLAIADTWKNAYGRY